MACHMQHIVSLPTYVHPAMHFPPQIAHVLFWSPALRPPHLAHKPVVCFIPPTHAPALDLGEDPPPPHTYMLTHLFRIWARIRPPSTHLLRIWARIRLISSRASNGLRT